MRGRIWLAGYVVGVVFSFLDRLAGNDVIAAAVLGLVAWRFLEGLEKRTYPEIEGKNE